MGRVGQWLLAAICLAGTATASPAAVDVTLQAAFPAPPYLVELLEAAAEENNTAYFPLLDRIADGRFDAARTDKDVYETFLRVLQDDGHISDPHSLSTFKLSLSVHASAPRIAAHYQYYNTTAQYVRPTGDGCETWVLKDNGAYCSSDLSGGSHTVPDSGSLRTLPLDRPSAHRKQSSEPILYADITSASFREFHKVLSAGREGNRDPYKLRHRPSTLQSQSSLAVSGYGVAMALKRTDYIVIDDRPAAEDTPTGDGKTEEHKHAVLDSDEEVADLKPLSSSELQQLGLKTASFVMASDDKFATLLKLAQDFPKYSSAIAGEGVNDKLTEELQENAAMFLPPGANVLWINGIQMSERDLDAFSLLEQLRREHKLIGAAKELGLSESQAIKLITYTDITDQNEQQDVQRYDWRDDNEGSKVIIWMNDIEKDRRYFDWPESVRALLKRSFPGQMPTLRKNVHHVILPVDFTSKTDIALVVDNVQSFVKRGVPVRFGLVPIAQTEAAEQAAKLVYHLCETYGLSTALAYLEAVLSGSAKAPQSPKQSHFEAAVHEKKLRKDRVAIAFQDILDDVQASARIENTRAYLTRLGSLASSAPYFANGVPIPRNDDWMQHMSNRVTADLRILQEGVYTGLVDDDSDLIGLFLEGASTRRNALIIPEEDKDTKILDLAALRHLENGRLGSLYSIGASESAFEAGFAQLFVVADFDTEQGAALFRNALHFRLEKDNVELVFVSSNPGRSSGFTEKLHNALSKAGTLSMQDLEAMEWEPASPENNDAANSHESLAWEASHTLLQILDIPLGSTTLILNGRVVGPFPSGSQLTIDDLDLLLSYEHQKRYQPALKALTTLGLIELAASPSRFATLISFMARSQKGDAPDGIFEGSTTHRSSIYSALKGEHSSFEIGDVETSQVQLVLAVDPASETGQRWLPIVKVLTDLAAVHAKIFLNPKLTLAELPVKRFYRNVLYPEPTFDAHGKVQERGAHFGGLPADALLTIGMDLPPAWLVSPKESIHDLDNLRLSSLKGDSVTAVYQLDHILIEGHSKDTTVTSAPRGAQLALKTGNGDLVADTLIMANLGYFQFKANPGFYDLSLQGARSQEIYHIDTTGSHGNGDDNSTGIALTSFRGTTLYPRLSRYAGMEKEDVLEPCKSTLEKTMGTFADTAGGVLNAIGLDGNGASGWLARAGQKVASLSNAATSSKAVATLPHADINIFSVASGHLYERMLNIMMVSVMKHTSHTVKFWFIEQFLSPSFKSFVPLLAEEYGFRYEMVTFKWPHWLRAQKEKQREIWGYKILFLDVLFPLDLDKVIFVDADQIVRTDMHELVQYDLQGAPYGFTPMCDSRTEMEGFRFWKQGYWKNFLRGLPYHISALYVVDLVRFRQMAAGDRLRQQYHQLSADAGSLSNLDQDLPNHMQNVLPIHSLPQEWLWCETWCSDESLGVAKTIDLCNNPQTKEPKLERARRQVPEWTIYDDEIAALAKRKAGQDGAVPGLGGNGNGEQERLQAEEYKRKLEEEKAKAQGGDRPRDEL